MNIFTNIIKGMTVYPQRMRQNMEITRGLLFSQRVLLALIDKGLSRQGAYKIVQRNAMATWSGEGQFIDLLKADPEVQAVLKPEELDSLFDYKYYTRHIDDIFKRVGLTAAQWKGSAEIPPEKLSPQSL